MDMMLSATSRLDHSSREGFMTCCDTTALNVR